SFGSRCPPFPYTTLFRSDVGGRAAEPDAGRCASTRARSAAAAASADPLPAQLHRLRRRVARDEVRAGGDQLAAGGEEPVARLLRSEEHTSELQSRVDLVC